MPLYLYYLRIAKRFSATIRPSLLVTASWWLLPQGAYAQLPIPEGLNTGDKYHLIFNSSSSTDATSGDISYYNAIVQDDANTAEIGQSEGVLWKALASTSSVHARDNAVIGGTTPVYNMNLELVATGHDDMWDGSVGSSLAWNESGTSNFDDAWTGSHTDGTAAIGLTLGGNVAWCGKPESSSTSPELWINRMAPPVSWTFQLYALSEELTVGPSIATLAGDYNLDGFINTADYTVWRDTYGSTSQLVADGNSDGAINTIDYAHWKFRFGNVVGSEGSVSTSTIPEPASGILGLITLLGFAAMRNVQPNLVA
jgi:hypothetical protein